MALACWSLYYLPLYILWPALFKFRHGFWPVARTPWGLYGFMDALLAVATFAYLVWLASDAIRGEASAPLHTGGGVGLLLVAALLRVWALHALGPHFRIGQDPEEPLPHVESGPYRFLRHPLHVSLVLAAVGQGLLTGLDLRAQGLLVVVGLYAFVQRIAEDRRWARPAV